jgi:hypothetical protein
VTGHARHDGMQGLVVTPVYYAAGRDHATSRSMPFMQAVLVAMALCACGSPATRPVEVQAPTEAHNEAHNEAHHADIAAAPAEIVVPLSGGANALLWDAATSTLYLTNNNDDALVQWTDAGGLQTVGTFPPASAGISLGGIVKRADGTRLVPSFGFGTQGTLFEMAADHTSRALTGLDATRRRVGLSQDDHGTLYSAYFVGGGGKAPTGGVATVTIAGDAATETEIAGPFKKPVGLVATPSAVFVSDQTQKLIFKIAVPGFSVSQLASVPTVDLLTMMPNGDLLTGGGPTISRITPTGTVTPLPHAAFAQVRGLAYDPTGKRLFVVDHSTAPGVPDKLHIVPLAN